MYICKHCNYNASSEFDLEAHIDYHSDNLICCLCNYKTHSSTDLVTHQGKVHPDISKKNASNDVSLNANTIITENEGKTNLKRKRKREEDKNNKVSKQTKSTKSNKDTELQTHICGLCGDQLVSEYDLSCHEDKFHIIFEDDTQQEQQYKEHFKEKTFVIQYSNQTTETSKVTNTKSTEKSKQNEMSSVINVTTLNQGQKKKPKGELNLNESNPKRTKSLKVFANLEIRDCLYCPNTKALKGRSAQTRHERSEHLLKKGLSHEEREERIRVLLIEKKTLNIVAQSKRQAFENSVKKEESNFEDDEDGEEEQKTDDGDDEEVREEAASDDNSEEKGLEGFKLVTSEDERFRVVTFLERERVSKEQKQKGEEDIEQKANEQKHKEEEDKAQKQKDKEQKIFLKEQERVLKEKKEKEEKERVREAIKQKERTLNNNNNISK